MESTMNRLKKSLVALCMVAAAALPAVSFAGGVAVGMAPRLQAACDASA
jgi:hypothetical protein